MIRVIASLDVKINFENKMIGNSYQNKLSILLILVVKDMAKVCKSNNHSLIVLVFLCNNTEYVNL